MKRNVDSALHKIMTSIVQCDCGASVRLPEQSDVRSVRCPNCKAGIALSASATALAATQLSSSEMGATCPIGQTAMGADEIVVACPKCEQVHHRDCWAEVGGCGTYGCSEAPSVEKDDASVQAPLTAWGDTKSCPVCGESIKSIALRCRYCQTDFNTVDPLTLGDLRRQDRTDKSAQSLRSTTIVLFALSLIGCLAPIIAIISLAVVLPKRQQLARAGHIYVVLGFCAIGISVIYSILMLGFFLQ